MNIDPTWDNQLARARLLSTDELTRHARVSTDNRHQCRECFTCACEEVRRERWRVTHGPEINYGR